MIGNILYPTDTWYHVSNEALDFTRKCLVVNPKERLSSEEALSHPFITNERSTVPLTYNFEQLKELNQKRKKWTNALNTAKVVIHDPKLTKKYKIYIKVLISLSLFFYYYFYLLLLLL